MRETDKEYYTRRGGEERKRGRTAATAKSQSIHNDLADLHHERANGSANVNAKMGIESSNPTAARSAGG
jgi:hypothetical protein